MFKKTKLKNRPLPIKIIILLYISEYDTILRGKKD